MRNKKAKTNLRYVVVSLLISVSVIGLIFAAVTIKTSGGTSSFVTVIEDTPNLYNVSINNTNIGVIANISYINITIPSSFTFRGATGSMNGTDTITSNITNTSTVLSFINTSVLIYGGNNSHFWFNASASTPGTYTIIIEAFNESGSTSTNLTVKVISPYLIDSAAGTSNFSIIEDTYTLVNLSINNTQVGMLANLSYINITIPDSFTFGGLINGTSATITNITNVGNIMVFYNSTYIINGTSHMEYFWFNASASTPGTYNITVDVANSLGANNRTSLNISITVNDTTSPFISMTSQSNNTNTTNAGLNLNYNITDNGVLRACWYYNGTIGGNISLGTGGDCTNISNVNWTEGRYNITIWANDTFNNQNSTTIAFTVDLSAPVVSLSCTPVSVVLGNLITCTCSRSDSLTGIASYSFTENPSTTNTGTYTTTCSASNFAGNSTSSSVSYTVEQGGGGPGSSGTSTTPAATWEVTHLVTDVQFKAGFTKEIKEKERFKITVSDENHYIGIAELTTTTAKIQVTSELQEVVLSVGETEKFEITDDDFYDLSVTLKSITNGKADIVIKEIHEEVPEELKAKCNAENLDLCLSEEVCTTADGYWYNDVCNAGEEGELEEGDLTWLWIVIGIVVVLVLVGVGYKVKKR